MELTMGQTGLPGREEGKRERGRKWGKEREWEERGRKSERIIL